MTYHLALACLGPVFLVQGRYVRRSTPVLPLPDGAVSGTSGDGRSLRILIAGDSAAAFQQSIGFTGAYMRSQVIARLICSQSWQK